MFVYTVQPPIHSTSSAACRTIHIVSTSSTNSAQLSSDQLDFLSPPSSSHLGDSFSVRGCPRASSRCCSGLIGFEDPILYYGAKFRVRSRRGAKKKILVFDFLHSEVWIFITNISSNKCAFDHNVDRQKQFLLNQQKTTNLQVYKTFHLFHLLPSKVGALPGAIRLYRHNLR